MAKRKKVTETVEESIVEQETAPEPELGREPLDVDTVLEELGEQAGRVYLYRFNVDAKSWDSVDVIPADSFSLKMVIDTYGGGRYRVKVREGTSGPWRSQTTFTIAGEPKLKPVKPVAPGEGGLPEGQMWPALLTAVLEAIRRPVDAGPVQGRDSLDAALKMVELMQAQTRPLLEALAGGAGRGGDDAWSAFDRGLELGENMGKAIAGGEGEGSAMIPLVRELVTYFQQARAEGKSVEEATKQARTQIQSQPAVTTWAGLLRGRMALLIRWAREDRDPEIYADVLLDEIGDAGQRFLAGRLSTPESAGQFVAELFQAFPEADDHRGWITSLISAIADRLFSEAEDDRDSASNDAGRRVDAAVRDVVSSDNARSDDDRAGRAGGESAS